MTQASTDDQTAVWRVGHAVLLCLNKHGKASPTAGQRSHLKKLQALKHRLQGQTACLVCTSSAWPRDAQDAQAWAQAWAAERGRGGGGCCPGLAVPEYCEARRRVLQFSHDPTW